MAHHFDAGQGIASWDGSGTAIFLTAAQIIQAPPEIWRRDSRDALVLDRGGNRTEWSLSAFASASPGHEPLEGKLIRWSPDGQKIAVCFGGKRYVSSDEQEDLCYVVNLETKRVKFIGYGYDAVWASDDLLLVTALIDDLPRHDRPKRSDWYHLRSYVDCLRLREMRRTRRFFSAAVAASSIRRRVVWMARERAKGVDLVETPTDDPTHVILSVKVHCPGYVQYWPAWANYAVTAGP